jgi:hypothetical protein
MFFNLSKKTLDNYPNHYHLVDDIILNCDNGWSKHVHPDRIVYFKGYCNDFSNENLPWHIRREPHLKGNFVAFVIEEGEIYITHDKHRGTPMYYNLDENYISNLETGKPVYADCLLTINKDFAVKRNWFSPYIVNDLKYTDEQIHQKLHNLLLDTFEKFVASNTLPIKMFLSGGLDTITAYTYLSEFTSDFELVDYEYIKHTYFWKQNNRAVQSYWGYKQIHLWDHPCVLVTGGNGDENFLRGPLTLDLMLKHHNTNISDVINNNPHEYHSNYFMKKMDMYDQSDYVDFDLTDFNKVQDYILNRNINDFQHWHLDRTLTFTPFKDLDILNLVMKGSKDLLVKQCLDGHINRHLIGLLKPDNLKLISDNKNMGNNLEHL